jgi:hypothetical protein
VGNTLGQAVDLFKCCIFTWKALTLVLPAFLIAGAVVVFVPTHSVMKYLGAGANRFLSYGVSAISGNVLTVCSCNVVPIFAGILRRGAGLGPAFCFVFAAPAIHLVNTILTYQIIGPRLALWRLFMVPVIALVIGAAMAVVFHKEVRAQREEQRANATMALIAATPGHEKKAGVFLGLLIVVLIFGASQFYKLKLFPSETVGIYVQLGAVSVALAVVGMLARTMFGPEETKEWLRQSGLLVRMIVPIFVPAVIVIAIIISHIPIRWIMPTATATGGLAFGTPQGNHLLPVFLSTLFGTLMYFPMITEVAFVKGLLKEGVAVGPALAILLGGPGLSLPGLLLIKKIAGWKKTLVYWATMVVLITLAAWAFGTIYGPYLCPCQTAQAR